MTILSYLLGPGTLKLGPAGAFDVSSQLTACKVTPSEAVSRVEAIPVLSGEELPAEESSTISSVLEGTFLQALEDTGDDGVVAYTWDNAGDEVAFEFIPSTAGARKVTGTVRLVPIAIGGDVSKTARPTSDFSWSVTSGPLPTFADVA